MPCFLSPKALCSRPSKKHPCSAEFVRRCWPGRTVCAGRLTNSPLARSTARSAGKRPAPPGQPSAPSLRGKKERAFAGAGFARPCAKLSALGKKPHQSSMLRWEEGPTSHVVDPPSEQREELWRASNRWKNPRKHTGRPEGPLFFHSPQFGGIPEAKRGR